MKRREIELKDAWLQVWLLFLVGYSNREKTHTSIDYLLLNMQDSKVTHKKPYPKIQQGGGLPFLPT